MIAEALLSLLALEEAGSVTAAAQRRHLSQPALTRQLQRLAAEAGVPLLRQVGRRAALTPAGEALAASARRQAADWEAALAAVQGERQAPLRLGCGTTIALTLLPPALRRLRAEEPGLALRIQAGDSAVTAARVLAGDADAGLVTTPPQQRRLLAVPLLRDPLLAVGPPGCPPRLSLAALAAGPLCLYARGTGFRQFVDELFAGAGLQVRPAAELDSLEAIRELVAAGLGFSLLPRSVVAEALAAGRIQAVAVPELPPAARTVTLLWRAERGHPALPRLQAALLEAAEALGGRGAVPARAGMAAPPS